METRVAEPALDLVKSTISDILVTISTVNPDSDTVALGTHRAGLADYTAVGQNNGFTYLQMPSAVYDLFKFFGGDWWEDVNKPFMEKMIDEGKSFALSEPIQKLQNLTPIPDVMREVNEVISAGYTYVSSVFSDTGYPTYVPAGSQ